MPITYNELLVPIQNENMKTDPTLRLKAGNVALEEISSDRIKQILRVLRSVMKNYKSVGISAPQIGIPLRIMMIEIPGYVVEHFGPEVCKTREMVTTPFRVSSMNINLPIIFITTYFSRFLLTQKWKLKISSKLFFLKGVRASRG